MKKIIQITLLFIVMMFLFQSCTTIRRIIYKNQYSNCPDNNPYYYFKKNNAKTTKQFKRNLKYR